jgi:hypothetical protein
MKRNVLKSVTLVTGVAACAALAESSQAQSVDALLDKLVDKGVLTAKEAKDLKAEADQNFTKAYAAKSGMPEWVTSLKINGDFRARYESFESPNDLFQDRQRFRYRLRFGATATIKDNFEVGLRLSSTDIDQGSLSAGLDPISNNQSLQNNGSRKGVGIDLAYAKYNFVNVKEASGAVSIGKIENPFTFSEMVFDHDYTPEGAGVVFTYRPAEQHALKFNGGTFVLDELSGTAHDPWLYGGQVRWDATWTKEFSSSAGVALVNIVNSQSLTNSQVPNINRGNTRDADGTLSYHFNPLVADAALTYTLNEAPFYKGPFPMKLLGTYMNNFAAPSHAGSQSYEGGVSFGKAGKKGTWEASYRWEYLAANSWYEEVTGSDFGAYYSTEPLNSGQTTATNVRYGAGTNVRGHIAKASYSVNDSLTISLTYYLTTLITEPPGYSGSSEMHRIQADLMWKF